MNVGNWMPFYTGDYLGDTARLTLEQHGAYLKLILDYWRNGPPPNDTATLARILGVPTSTWRRLAPVVLPFFRIEDGALRHKRIDAELAVAQERKGVAVERAKRGAAARWASHASSNASSNASSTPQAMLEQCPPPLPKEEPKNLRVAEPHGFARFWQAYPRTPRKVAKVKCCEVWTRRSLESQADAIVAHVVAMRGSKQWLDGFEPAPLTYIRQSRWQDDTPASFAEGRRDESGRRLPAIT